MPILAIVCGLGVAGQVPYDLAVSYDGSVLYFSQFVGGSAPVTRLFRWTEDGGTALFREGAHLYGTQLTYDGAVLYHSEPPCSTGTGPGFNNCTAGETRVVVPGREEFSVPGFLLISPNGRYGVFATFEHEGLWVDWATGEEITVDFGYQGIPAVSPPFSVNQHAVADSGSFLIAGPLKLRVWSRDGETALPAGDSVQNAMISANGRTVALTARDLEQPAPVPPTDVFDLRTGARTRLALVVSVSGDGETLAYLSADPFVSYTRPQAVVARADGGAARQVGEDPDGVQTAALSGDGRYLFVVSRNAETPLRRYDLATNGVIVIK